MKEMIKKFWKFLFRKKAEVTKNPSILQPVKEVNPYLKAYHHYPETMGTDTVIHMELNGRKILFPAVQNERIVQIHNTLTNESSFYLSRFDYATTNAWIDDKYPLALNHDEIPDMIDGEDNSNWEVIDGYKENINKEE